MSRVSSTGVWLGPLAGGTWTWGGMLTKKKLGLSNCSSCDHAAGRWSCALACLSEVLRTRCWGRLA